MSPSTADLIQVLAIGGVLLGFAGIVLPLVPGPAVIWSSLVAWAWADDFATVGWPTLLVITIMAVTAQGADLILGAVGARKSGVSVRTLVIASLAAIAGFVVLSVPGALIAAAGSLFILETRRDDGSLKRALRTSSMVFLGYVLATVLEVTLCVGMVAIFVVAAMGG